MKLGWSAETKAAQRRQIMKQKNEIIELKNSTEKFNIRRNIVKLT